MYCYCYFDLIPFALLRTDCPVQRLSRILRTYYYYYFTCCLLLNCKMLAADGQTCIELGCTARNNNSSNNSNSNSKLLTFHCADSMERFFLFFFCCCYCLALRLPIVNIDRATISQATLVWCGATALGGNETEQYVIVKIGKKSPFIEFCCWARCLCYYGCMLAIFYSLFINFLSFGCLLYITFCFIDLSAAANDVVSACFSALITSH